MTTSIIKAEQTARTTERILIKLYENILKDITLDPNYPQYPDALQREYYRTVYDVTRKAIETVYIEALNYVGSSLKIDTFLTSTDIEIIKTETEKAVAQFFTSLRRGAEVQQQHDTIMLMEEQQQRYENMMHVQLYGGSILDPVLGLFASAARNAVSVITGGFSKAVTSKASQLYDSLEDRLFGEDEQMDENGVRVTYYTQFDERVCPRCGELNGMMYYANDNTKPEIPDDLHPNCRCFYEIVPEYIYMEKDKKKSLKVPQQEIPHASPAPVGKSAIQDIFPEFEQRIDTGARFKALEISDIDTPITRVKAEDLADTMQSEIESRIHSLPTGQRGSPERLRLESYDPFVSLNNPKRTELKTWLTDYAEHLIRKHYKGTKK